jgi:hypothetical protein
MPATYGEDELPQGAVGGCAVLETLLERADVRKNRAEAL